MIQPYTLIITANSVNSTDPNFTMENLALGDDLMIIDVYYQPMSGDIIRRNRAAYEREISNRTMARIAFQVFEKDIIALSLDEKNNFPTCKYSSGGKLYKGIFSNKEEFEEQNGKTNEYIYYNYDNEKQFIIYGWNLFSTILFAQECLKRFGEEDDCFILTYREKSKKEISLQNEQEFDFEYIGQYAENLVNSKNIIFHGAPGTGKSYLAKQIAAMMISDGKTSDCNSLDDNQKKQIEFVQFHPSYDYSDFVEGLRPKINNDGSMGFELRDGIFKRFVALAKKNSDDSKKSQAQINKEFSTKEMMDEYFSSIEFGIDILKTIRGAEFYIIDVDDKYIHISIPDNMISNQLSLNIHELQAMLESDQEFTQVKDITHFFQKLNATQHYSYQLAIYKAIKSQKTLSSSNIVKAVEQKPFIFIIDEINRGEISKIFGELFFAIDPGYRGTLGEVSTQYSNLHESLEEKFYIPENVYIIGTMNDIDRSVDIFDFAMRRRFRFIEIKANENIYMLNVLKEKEQETIARMTALNQAISNVDDLNDHYHIGAAYFLKLQSIDFDQLWSDYLQSLLYDYVRGMHNEIEIMESFKNAYSNAESEIDHDANN